MPRHDIFVHENVAPLPGKFNTLAIREDLAYTDARGRQKNGIRKQAQKILGKVEPILAKMLRPTEAIFYVARMNAPIGPADQLTGGWMFQRMIVVAMVFTNERLICFPITYAGKWKGSVRIVWYSDLDPRTKVSGMLGKALELHYGLGNKDRYWGVRRRDAKKLTILLRILLAENTAPPVSQGMVSLCAECLKPLTAGVYQCASCGLVFKDERTMRKRALLIPGGGYFYCGATGMGVLTVLGELYILLHLLSGFIILAAAFFDPPEERAGDIAAGSFVLLFAGVVLAVEKFVQMHHCKRMIGEFISTGEKKPVTPSVTATATGTR